MHPDRIGRFGDAGADAHGAGETRLRGVDLEFQGDLVRHHGARQSSAGDVVVGNGGETGGQGKKRGSGRQKMAHGFDLKGTRRA